MTEQSIWISIGTSRFDKNWKNKEIPWKGFLGKLHKPIMTPETHDQYLKYPKEKQDAIKDVGGFVGGTISGGRRKVNSVTARYLITLDVDYAPADFFTDVCLAFDNELVIYATHKNGPNMPRFRLVMPLAREVHADEYEAISRKIAEKLDIELFDPTTFQPERLMYWPSHSSDVEYYIQRQKGPWIDPDTILAQYDDWRDVASWPVSENAKKKIKDGVDKQESPEDKNGIVGVWCRTYGIKEVMEKFLNEIYEPTDYEDRWTFSLGSTSAGVVVYDNEFSFSHHSTDPTCGRLCNSFDLVRVHLFGESDDRVEEGTPFIKRPSYGKMVEFALNDDEVKRNLLLERVEDRSELMNSVLARAGEGVNWAAQLEHDKRGKAILQTIANVVLILDNDEKLKGCLAYDDLRKIPTVLKDLPWRKVSVYSSSLTDADEAELRNYLEVLYGITNKDKIRDAIEIVTRKNLFHPVRDYLKSIKWDGKERLERLLVDYLGADDSAYVREVTRKTFVAAVARVFNPGCKFDNVLVLVGSQGIGKSMILSKLGGDWFSDTFGNLQSKDAMENIQGIWIMELGELAGLRKQEIETVKLFISKQKDRFRVAYARRVEEFPRQCIFIGTTNNDEFLQDQTGNRRWWPVRCHARSVKMLYAEDRDQLWAEAAHYYGLGEDLYLSNEIEGLAREIQEEHTEKDDRTKMIIDYLEIKVPYGWYDLSIYDKISFLNGDETVGKGEMIRDHITVPEIWTELMKGQVKDMSAYNVKYIRNIMNKMDGWEPKMLNRKPFGYQRGWSRTADVTIEQIMGVEK